MSTSKQIRIIMGMEFEAGEEPDFGSIRRTSGSYNGKNEYLLKSTDIEKLDLIVENNGASDGSTALCSDTAELFLLHLGEWVKVGANGGE